MRYRAMVLLATCASLRWGGVAGLSHKNIDLKACTVRAEATVIELGGTSLTDQEPKSEAGRRVVAFPDQLRPMLAAHLRDIVAGTTVAAQTGATLKELMSRISHPNARAAIIYQHAAAGRDRTIAAALDRLVKAEQSKMRVDRKRQGRKPPTVRTDTVWRVSGTRALGRYQDLGLSAVPCWWEGVDLVGTYSKRQDLADQLRRVLDRLGRAHEGPVEDPEHSVRTTAKAAEPHRVADRLGQRAVRELVEAFDAGTSKWRLAEQYGISLSSVKRLLREHLARNGCNPPAQE